MKVFNDANFPQEVLQAAEPVVVDFWSGTCGDPCSDTENMLRGLEPLYPTITFGTMLSDANPVTTQQYAITVYPTVLIFNKGVVVDRFDGEPTQIELINALNALVPHLARTAS
jgi:thioredoxin 1